MTNTDQYGPSSPTVGGAAAASSPPAGMVGKSSKGLAIASFVCALCLPLPLGPIALALGITARRKMRAANNFDGQGMALAGTVIGGIDTAIIVLVVLLASVYGVLSPPWRRNPDAVACRDAVATAARIAPLATGEVAALAVAHSAFLVPDLAFKDDSGQVRALKDWRGRTVLLNLWATWCVPCRKEMPALDALQARLGGDKFQVVAVNIDTRDPQKPRKFLQQVGATHLAYFTDDSAQVFETLKEAGKAFGMPTTLIVGPNGCEIGTMAGPAEWASADGVKLVSAAIDNVQ